MGMQSNNVINFRLQKQVRELTALQLANLKYYFDTENHGDTYLYRLLKKEIKRRELIGEMYEDIAYAD